MPDRTYLVEHYWPGSTATAFTEAMARVEAAVARMADGGTPIRLLHSTFVPRDEGGLSLIVADSEATVRAGYRAAGVGFDRIVEAVDVDPADREGTG